MLLCFIVDCGRHMRAAAAEGSGLTHLDIAKFVIEFLITELRRARCINNETSFVLIARGKGKSILQCSYHEPLSSFERTLKDLDVADDEEDLEAATAFCLELISKYRVERDLDLFGQGCRPWITEQTHIILCTSGEAVSRPGGGLTGARREATRDPSPEEFSADMFRWDQRVYVVCSSQQNNCIVPALVEDLSKRSRGSTLLSDDLHSLLRLVHDRIVAEVRQFTVAPSAACALRFGSSEGALTVPVSLTPSTRSSHTSPQQGSPPQWMWPIPEVTAVNRYTNSLPRRPGHPTLTVSLSDSDHLSNGRVFHPPGAALLAETLRIAKDIQFPFDSYVLEVYNDKFQEYDNSAPPTPAHSTLRQWVQGSLNDGSWSAVYVWDELGEDVEGVPGQAPPTVCGMLRASRSGESFEDGRVLIELLLFPFHFCQLIPLVKSGAEYISTSQQGGGFLFPQQWQQDMKKYTSSVSAYLYPTLTVAMKKYQLQNCIPRNNEVPMFGKTLRRRLERLHAVCCADLACMQVALYENESAAQCRELSLSRSLLERRDDSPLCDETSRHTLYNARDTRSIRCSNQALNISDILVDGATDTRLQPPYARPLYNGGPDVTPWPATVLASFRAIGSGNATSPYELYPLETCDLLHTWESLRKNMYGGGGSLTVRGMTVDGVQGTGSHVRHVGTSQRKRKRTEPVVEGDTEWRWWYRACGASRVPVLTGRSMGDYAAVMANREGLRDPSALDNTSANEDSREGQLSRKYAVNFGSPFEKKKSHNGHPVHTGPKEKTDVLPDSEGRESDPALPSEAVSEQDLLMYDCVEGNLFPIQAEQLPVGSEQGKNEFASLFVDTPRPEYDEESSSGTVVLSDGDSVSRVLTMDLEDASGTLSLPPLKRSRPPLKNSSTYGIHINYDADKTLSAEIKNATVDLKSYDSPTTPETTIATPIDRLNMIGPVAVNEIVKKPAVVTTATPPADTPWIQRFSNKHKCNYWFNTLDGSSQWSPPTDWVNGAVE